MAERRKPKGRNSSSGNVLNMSKTFPCVLFYLCASCSALYEKLENSI